jgi:gliding motility-associated-like protein
VDTGTHTFLTFLLLSHGALPIQPGSIECPTPEITLTEIDHFLNVDIITPGGWMISDTAYFPFLAEKAINAPTVLSANEDSNNDSRTIYSSPRANVNFRNTLIFDRWGKLVFTLPSTAINNPNEGWDGGEHLPGVYVYRCEYEDSEGRIRYIVGDLTLVR